MDGVIAIVCAWYGVLALGPIVRRVMLLHEARRVEHKRIQSYFSIFAGQTRLNAPGHM